MSVWELLSLKFGLEAFLRIPEVWAVGALKLFASFLAEADLEWGWVRETVYCCGLSIQIGAWHIVGIQGY